MKDKNIICREFVSMGAKGVCNVYRELLLPLYPNRYETEVFCKTENHQKCPILNSSLADQSVCV